MADFLCNISKGKLNAYAQNVEDNSPSGCKLRVVLYKTFSGSDAAYIDADTQAAVEAISTTTTADFTNYVDKTLAAGDITFAVDDSGNKAWVDASDITWTSAGGASNNTLVKMGIYYDPDGSDTAANNIPLGFYDFAITTNGSDLQATIHADGLWSAS